MVGHMFCCSFFVVCCCSLCFCLLQGLSVGELLIWMEKSLYTSCWADCVDWSLTVEWCKVWPAGSSDKETNLLWFWGVDSLWQRELCRLDTLFSLFWQTALFFPCLWVSGSSRLLFTGVAFSCFPRLVVFLAISGFGRSLAAVCFPFFFFFFPSFLL